MSSKFNVLVLSAGRRVELVQSFQAEASRRGIGTKVFAADLRPHLAAACHVADRSFEVPRVTATDYISSILQICDLCDVGLVIPTIDSELEILATNSAEFANAGVQVSISDERVVSLCRDKRKTSALFSDLDIRSPAIFEPNAIQFPCFAKPFDGSRSIGARYVESAEDLHSAELSRSNMMFMEFIDSSYDEYTIDAYFGFDGNLKCMVPRQRIEVRDGEISKGVTRKNYVYEYLWPRLEKLGGGRGCLTVQIFARDRDKNCFGIEINPRFGGGYPLAYAAGANYPGWLMDECFLGLPVNSYDGWEQDLLMLRYDSKILISNAF